MAALTTLCIMHRNMCVRLTPQRYRVHPKMEFLMMKLGGPCQIEKLKGAQSVIFPCPRVYANSEVHLDSRIRNQRFIMWNLAFVYRTYCGTIWNTLRGGKNRMCLILTVALATVAACYSLFPTQTLGIRDL